MDEDTRNVINKYKHMPHDAIMADLDDSAHGLEIAVENVDRDFNMGTIIRNANAFGVRHVHIIGRRQWNKRGAMMTDKYLHVHYYESSRRFIEQNANVPILAIDNVESAVPLKSATLPEKCIMVFGSEKSGISEELLSQAAAIIEIEQRGSTRSVNVGVASGIAMYAWLERHAL
jgi:tRNA G18 (ribose-2'-O)-methylase SpoU